MKTLQSTTINPANSVFVIVDVENEFCTPGGYFYSPAKAEFMPRVINAIKGFSEKARDAGIPIIYIQSVRNLTEPEFTVFGREPHLQINTWGTEIVDQIKPREGDIVIQKFSHDAFLRKDLDDALARLVPDPTMCQAIITGGSISVCVFHAVLGFYLRSYWTVVLTDGVFYRTEDTKQASLEHLSQGGYPNIFMSRSDLISVSNVAEAARPALAIEG